MGFPGWIAQPAFWPILRMMVDLGLIGIALLGTLAGAMVALVPGLHIYNVAGGVILVAARMPVGDEPLALFWVGLVIGWAMVNVIPSIFLFAPDDANAFTVLPATKFLLRGHGFEAALLIGAGSLGALACLSMLAPALSDLLRPLRAIVQPHYGWILVAIIAFMILSEWPRNPDPAVTPLRRLLAAWAYLGAGLLTFTLSGVLGLVLTYSSPIAQSAASMNLLPAFVGLFAVPGLLQILLVGSPLPRQLRTTFEVPVRTLLRGTLSGVAGGLFAGFLPVISGGIGAMLSGAATAQRDDRLFLVSQGAAKITYYTGSLLLLFVPGLALARGGMAWMLSTLYIPSGYRIYWLAVAAIALCGILAFGLLLVFARLASALAGRINVRLVAMCALAVAVTVTVGFTGLEGLAIMSVSACIGLIPVFIGGRRMNCLGVLLVPMTLNMIGIGPSIAQALGLSL